jgi:uncharacterized membrane protein
MDRVRRSSTLTLATLFTASGIVHLVRPQFFLEIMPRAIPEHYHRGLVYASGVVELVCAEALIRRRPVGPAISTAVLLAVFPANVQMALDAGTGRHPGATDNAVVAWGRLPLQALMVWAALQGRRPASAGD